MNDSKKGCCCPCHKAPGILLILFGLAFLLRNLGVLPGHVADIIWPSVIVLAGLKKTFAGMCKCCKGACSTEKTE